MASLSLSGQTRQRQIVILAVGSVLLGGLLLFQVPRILKMLGPPKSNVDTTETAPPPVTPPLATSPAPTPVTPVGASTGALPSPSRFKGKDPFVQQVNPGGASAGATADADAPASFTPVGTAKTGAADTDSAMIAVNGSVEDVDVSAGFPDDKPVFKLVSVSGNTAKIGIAGGSLKGGSPTVTLTKGEPLTLLNTVDGKRYKLELK